MSSAVIRIGVVVLALAQLGVTSFYAPVHRLLHHTLRPVVTANLVASANPLAPVIGCRSSCCQHHAKKAEGAANSSSVGRTPLSLPADSPCPDDEDSCVWCAIALQQAAPAAPAVVAACSDPVVFVSTPGHFPVAARPAAPFDVRGPPTL